MRMGDTFVVPPYQRNYAWEENQYGEFWFDISKTFSSNTPEYFLGSIVINNAQAPQLYVIDGQQRLITTAILISALRNHLKAEGQAKLASLIEKDFLVTSDYERQLSAPCLVLNKSDKTFYDTYLFHNRPAAEIYRLAEDDTLSPSNRLLAECFRFMHRRLGELRSNDWALEDLAGAIIECLNARVLVIRIDVKDDYDAFLLFETLNDRGLELSEADLLKNRLFAVSAENLPDVQNKAAGYRWCRSTRAERAAARSGNSARCGDWPWTRRRSSRRPRIAHGCSPPPPRGSPRIA
jgi:hypothetical protein